MVNPQAGSPVQRACSLWLVVSFLAMGALVVVLAAFGFRRVVAGLGEKEVPRDYWTHQGVWTHFALAVLALAMAGYFIRGY